MERGEKCDEGGMTMIFPGNAPRFFVMYVGRRMKYAGEVI